MNVSEHGRHDLAANFLHLNQMRNTERSTIIDIFGGVSLTLGVDYFPRQIRKALARLVSARRSGRLFMHQNLQYFSSPSSSFSIQIPYQKPSSSNCSNVCSSPIILSKFFFWIFTTGISRKKYYILYLFEQPLIQINMYQERILEILTRQQTVTSSELQTLFNTPTDKIYSQILSLQSNNYIEFEAKKTTKLVLTKEGEAYSTDGSPEFLLYSSTTVEGVNKKTLSQKFTSLEAYQLALSNAVKNKLVLVKEDVISRTEDGLADKTRDELVWLKLENEAKLTPEIIRELKRRKLAEERHRNVYVIRKGRNYKEKLEAVKTELTSAMLADGLWKTYQFKEFNPNSQGAAVDNGNLHPLMKTKQQFTEVLTEMGFEQMKTNRYVESSFWNFDSLFQPQAHPARDAHDTFFLSSPAKSIVEDQKYFEETRKIHEVGGYGSIGLNYSWNPDEAFKNILRTHTTAISSRYLKMLADDLAKGKEFRPRKFFSIDRVFRNETLDSTHLAEFHQVQGFIIDYDLGLADLIGILTAFYNRIGIKDIKVKPTFNPYTEPSMEVFGYHPILKKKVEIGNSGIFRPEMLRPMGFPENVSVIAWGLSLERPTMIQFGLENIKELFGTSVKKVKESAIHCI